MTFDLEPVTVYWEDDPKRTRVVHRCCPTCYPNGEQPWDIDVVLVSRVGAAHQTYGDTTDCGRDATGPGWWWAS
jgi:hypothetical protein